MWMRVDDGLHAHRKTRAVTKSHPTKSRDAAPMGLWILAGSWAAQNGTDGWVPEDELDRFDSEWKPLVDRLVRAGYWWPHERNKEPGFGFNDWHDYNDPANAASKAGSFGNHVRWHVNEGKVIPDCEHCPKEPDEPEDRGAIGGRSGGESHPDPGAIAPAIALPEPEPQPEPDPNPGKTLVAADAAETNDDFAEFWKHYPRKVAKPKALAAYKAARKKAGAEDILRGLVTHLPRLSTQEPRFVPHPATWLNGERWNDDPPPADIRKGDIDWDLALERARAIDRQKADSA